VILGLVGNCVWDGSNCITRQCDYNSDCDDGAFCNGAETCSAGGICVAGTAPDCDDGLFCNGLETCSGNSCVGGTAPDCDDGDECTVNDCDEGSDSCAAPVLDCSSDGTCCAGCSDDEDCDDGTIPCSSCSDCGTKLNAADPGEIVVLDGSISSSGSCMRIYSSGVTFDCDGHTITGPGSHPLVIHGIESRGDDNTIQNCVLRNYETQISIWAAERNKIIDCDASNGVGRGITVTSSSDYLEMNNVVSNNNVYDGIIVWDTDYIDFDAVTSNNNGDTGIYLSNSHDSTFYDVVASGNGESGLFIWGNRHRGRTVTANSNSDYGVWLVANSNIFTSTVTSYNGVRNVFDDGVNNCVTSAASC